MKPKLFRDPVHDIITLDLDDLAGRMLYGLLQTPEVQRLRHIRQLGLANLVYHGAEHSRFAHSLGVVHIASRILERIHQRLPLTLQDRLSTLAAALLHDIGHGPFSHAIERVTGVHHEAYTLQAILDPDTGVHNVLQSIDPTLPAHVADLIRPTTARTFRTDIVSSQLDADRLDYLLRDGLSTGVKIGFYDLERILSMLYAEPGHIVINGRAKEAVEGYLLARFHMFKQVYLHKAVRSAEVMLRAALSRASSLLRNNPTSLPTPHPALSSLLAGHTLPIHDYTLLDDSDIWHALKLWESCNDPHLSELARGIRRRTLYKSITLPTAPSTDALIQTAREAVIRHGGDPEVHLLVDRASDTPYKPYRPHLEDTKQRPIILSSASRLHRIEELSDLAVLLGQARYNELRIFFPEHLKRVLVDIVESHTP